VNFFYFLIIIFTIAKGGKKGGGEQKQEKKKKKRKRTYTNLRTWIYLGQCSERDPGELALLYFDDTE
jgi:hypothetical protein